MTRSGEQRAKGQTRSDAPTSTKKSPKAARTRATRGSGSSEWSKRLGIGSAAAVVLFLVAVVALNSPPVRGIPDGTETVAVEEPAHVEGDIHEEGEVPAGGAHSAIWQNCGFYDTEIRSENAVHSLEHGAVWITYQPSLPQEQVDRLAGFTNRQDKILVSPVADQPAPIIATAWANQLELADASDERLSQFINEFEGSPSAPEPGGSCSGGVS